MNKENNVYSSGTEEEVPSLSEMRRKKVEAFRLQLDLEEDKPEKETSTEVFSRTDPSETTDSAPKAEDNISSFSTVPEKKEEPMVPREEVVSGKKKKLRNKKNSGIYVLIYTAIVCLISAGLAVRIIHAAFDLLGAYKEDNVASIKITPKTSVDEVIDQLVAGGVIEDPAFFKLYFKITDAKVAWGDYTISTNMDYEALIAALNNTKNRVDTVQIMFPEGTSAEEIADRLETEDVCGKQEFLDALNNLEPFMENYYFVKDIPDDPDRVYKLEGYLFPDTYEFYKYESPVKAVKIFLNNYLKRVTAEMLEQAESHGMTMDEILTLASLIEKEAKTQDMRKVSSVFHNRLDIKMMLQSNATDLYPYTAETIPEGYAEISPYNTYRIEGLPPGAICNPGLAAIRAALNPEKTEYYYFCMDASGKAYYAVTLAQHEQNLRAAGLL